MTPPLRELYELLRGDGFPIGVDDHVRVSRLLSRDVAWDFDTLRTAIASLVVKDVRDRPRFDACWERWLHAARREEQPQKLAPVALPPRRWPWIVVAVVVLAAAGAAASHFLRGQRATEVVHDTAPPADAPPAVAPTEVGSSAPPPPEPRKVAVPPHEHSRPPEPSRDVQAIALAIAATGGALLVALALGAAIVARRRRQFLPGPWRYRVTIPPANKPVLSRLDIEDGATDLTWQAHEQGHELDIDRTVARTAAAGGMPVIAHRKPPAAPRYIVLEDMAAGTERWRWLYDELLRGLAREGVEIERATFIGSPEACRTMAGKDVVLRDLLEQVDALIVIGDGDAAVDPLTGERAEWLATLRHVPRRLWINPLPTRRWSEGARAIAIDTPMEHGVAHALAALHAGVDRTDRERAFPAIIERAPATATALAALRAYLGERAFQLVGAVATTGQPTIAAARWLAEKLELSLEEQDWLRITALPWFGQERWPEGVRERLRESLAIDIPTLAERADVLAERVLAASEPKPGSAAHLAWQLDRAERAGREVAVRALGVITTTPLAHAARQRLAALGLPDRRRRWATASVATTCVLIAGGAASFLASRTHDSRAAADYAAATRDRQLKALTPDHIEATPDTKLAVQVLDGNGDPVAGAAVGWVNDHNEKPDIVSPSETDADGVADYGLLDSVADEHDAIQTAYADAPRGQIKIDFHYHVAAKPSAIARTYSSLGNEPGEPLAPTDAGTPAGASDAVDPRTRVEAKDIERMKTLLAAGKCKEAETALADFNKHFDQVEKDLRKTGGEGAVDQLEDSRATFLEKTDKQFADCWQRTANALATQVIEKISPSLQKCLGNENPVTVSLTVNGRLDASGQIAFDVNIDGLGRNAVAGCMTAQLKGLQVWPYNHPINISVPLALGTPTSAEITNWPQNHYLSQLDSCYQHNRGNSTDGDIKWRFTLDGPKVTNAKVTGVNTAVDRCMEGVILGMQLPPATTTKGAVSGGGTFKPEVNDTPDDAAANRVIDGVAADLDTCGRKAKASAYRMLISITRDGHMSGVSFTYDDVASNPALEECVRGLLSKLTFPTSRRGGPVARAVTVGAPAPVKTSSLLSDFATKNDGVLRDCIARLDDESVRHSVKVNITFSKSTGAATNVTVTGVAPATQDCMRAIYEQSRFPVTKDDSQVNASLELGYDALAIHQIIRFTEGDGVEVVAAEDSYLKEVVAILKAHPRIRVQAVGYAGEAPTGEKDANAWAAQRAQNVVKRLVELGADAARLSYAAGPFETPTTDPKEQAMRRRVEFRVLSPPAAPPRKKGK